MFEGIQKYANYKSQQEIKEKMTRDSPQRELAIAMRILKAAGYPIRILEHSKQNGKYPVWMNRMDTFDMLEMFASEFERGIYQKTEEIENTKRLIKDLERAHDIMRSKERDIAHLEQSRNDYARRLNRAMRKLEKEGIEAKDEWGMI